MSGNGDHHKTSKAKKNGINNENQQLKEAVMNLKY